MHSSYACLSKQLLTSRLTRSCRSTRSRNGLEPSRAEMATKTCRQHPQLCCYIEFQKPLKGGGLQPATQAWITLMSTPKQHISSRTSTRSTTCLNNDAVAAQLHHIKHFNTATHRTTRPWGAHKLPLHCTPRGATQPRHDKVVTLSDVPFQGTWIRYAALSERAGPKPIKINVWC